MKKVCSKCEIEKLVSEFFKDKRVKSGLYAICKDCHRQNLRDNYRSSYKSGKNYKTNLRRRIANRFFRKAFATPRWLHPVDIFIMVEMEAYMKEGYSLDHIVPISSDRVCGLNVPWNLQILSKEENLSKGNYWWPDMWEES